MIADQIKEIRNLLGLTQEALARKLDVGFVTVNRWENQVRNPSPLAMKRIMALAKVAGVEIENPRPKLRLNRSKK